jgi:hypothetical protein
MVHNLLVDLGPLAPSQHRRAIALHLYTERCLYNLYVSLPTSDSQHYTLQHLWIPAPTQLPQISVLTTPTLATYSFLNNMTLHNPVQPHDPVVPPIPTDSHNTSHEAFLIPVTTHQ